MVKLLMVATGGAVGAVLRYLVSGWTQKLTGGSLPWGTFAVNILGCLALGFLGAVFTRFVPVREEYRLLLLVGGLGAFTTFSTFGFETFALLNDGQRGLALANVLLSNAAGLAAVWIAYRLAERTYGA
ncbi:MAG: fluoride efflux transporter CrcB [bacterium]|nr:fluoride efflux transporter CrcB [bacterium]